MTAPLPPGEREPLGPPFTPPSWDTVIRDQPTVPKGNPGNIPAQSQPREFHSPVEGVIREPEEPFSSRRRASSEPKKTTSRAKKASK